jgi:hypothetical protein
MDAPLRAGEAEPATPRGVLGGSLLVALLLLVAHLAYGFAFELPIPKIHDEFAYLLAGETFAAGRVTNPPHPVWDHFETFHVFHQPTYQGKYPPAQGGFLALGFLLGHPAFGVWLSLALAGAAACWMLAALVPRGWAVAGTLLFAVNFEVFRLWGQSYWGGAVAMLGGALFFGGLARLDERARPHLAWAMALGLFLLANSRPLEGAVAAALTVPVLLLRMRAQAQATSRATMVRTLALPLAVGCAAVAAWTLFYNWRLTGQPFEMPHDHWRARDAVNDGIRSFRGSTERSLLGKLQNMQRLYVGTLALAVPFLVLRLRSKAVLYAGVVVAVPALMSLYGSRAWPHYIAPVTVPIVFLTVESLRGLASLRIRGARVGAVLAAGLIAAHVVGNARLIGIYVTGGPDPQWYRERQGMITALEEQGGEHLILVRYEPEHDVHEEWVFNAADIDGAPIVWARDKGAESNRDLLAHFARRSLWSVNADETPRRLLPFTEPPP